jgi:hypothetical protein
MDDDVTGTKDDDDEGGDELYVRLLPLLPAPRLCCRCSSCVYPLIFGR